LPGVAATIPAARVVAVTATRPESGGSNGMDDSRAGLPIGTDRERSEGVPRHFHDELHHLHGIASSRTSSRGCGARGCRCKGLYASIDVRRPGLRDGLISSS
jgi:hypothetical protein